ncbi:homeobox protein CDX-4 [Stigmatopora nigra]
MYVGYLLDKESGMYHHQGPVRRSSINLPSQNFVSSPQYPDFSGYHHVPNVDSHGQAGAGWGPSAYGPPREDWGGYGVVPPNALAAPVNNSSPAQVSYCSPEYTHMHPPPASGSVSASVSASAVLPPPPPDVVVGGSSGGGGAHVSPDRERRNSYQWMNKTAQSSSTGKTRTKEKYRVVYTDHQRLELEKEFHFNRYITIRRKAELAVHLGLSERQVKIWFQNRRAKERKLIKKKMGQSDGSGGSVHSDPGSVSPLPVPGSLSPTDIHGALYSHTHSHPHQHQHPHPHPHPPPPQAVNTLPPIRNIQQVTVSQ